MLGSTVQSLVATATWRQGFLHPWIAVQLDLIFVFHVGSLKSFVYLCDESRIAHLQMCSVTCLFVSLGVRGKPRVYCSLLAYCTARFGRPNFGHQMPPRLPTRSAL
jgi:hypothetical protein